MRGDFMCDKERAELAKRRFIDEMVQAIMLNKAQGLKEVAELVLLGVKPDVAMDRVIDNIRNTMEDEVVKLRHDIGRRLRDATFDV